MKSMPTVRFPTGAARSVALALALLTAGLAAPGTATAQLAAPALNPADPRATLRAGLNDAGVAAWNLELVVNRPRPAGFHNPAAPGDFAFANADLAFRGRYVFQGGYHGFQVWDLGKRGKATLRTTFVCPGGQGDLSVFGNLLFMSVEETRGRVDCGTQGVADTVSAERFRGVRIFDISHLDAPKQVAAVQTCRGSHTHTLVTDPRDPAHVYVYVAGTSPVRPAAELAGCSGRPPEVDPQTSLFQIEVIRVPLARPAEARIVSEPRLFADRATGKIAGLWRGGDHGAGTQTTAETNMCHDITAYPELGLAAGACSGNGILIDIRDPANPKRIAEVSDPNFAYWHSATFNNDGTSLIFTDEWGGGMAPRCRITDRPEWGANALFTLANGTLTPVSYYKLPAPQTEHENCVAHNGSLIPVPGRDLKVQAWYQGGISVLDFTDPHRPFEIAYFDRGPVSSERLELGGHWSAYWYNGYIVGSEIARGLDVLRLAPSEHLTQNEIDAALLVQLPEFNAQLQPRFEWPAAFVVARAYLDQLERSRGLSSDRLTAVRQGLARAERQRGDRRSTALGELASTLEADAGGSTDASRIRKLIDVVRQLATSP